MKILIMKEAEEHLNAKLVKSVCGYCIKARETGDDRLHFSCSAVRESRQVRNELTRPDRVCVCPCFGKYGEKSNTNGKKVPKSVSDELEYYGNAKPESDKESGKV